MNTDAEHLKQLAYVCSCLRKERKPDKVIALTENVLRYRSRYVTSDGFDRILCTRGAAFRDIGRPEEALRCALESIEVKSVFCYAYNLAGAAYYNLGQFTPGDRFFAEAHKRGADEAHIDRLKKSARRQWEQTQPTPAVSVPSDARVMPVDSYGDDEEMSMGIDGDALRELDLIHEELSDLSDSFQRSNDNGWFYSDEE
jgi:tetratricopeptide (TPR) repeat protein